MDELFKKNIRTLLNDTQQGDSNLASVQGKSTTITVGSTVQSFPATDFDFLYAFLYIYTADILLTTDGSDPDTATMHGIARGANQTHVLSKDDYPNAQIIRMGSTDAVVYIDYKYYNG